MKNKIRTSDRKLYAGIIFVLLGGLFISCEEFEETDSAVIEYKIQNYKIVSEDCDTAGRCAYVEFNYPVFSAPQKQPSTQILNSYVSSALLAYDYADSSAASIDVLGTEFIEEYEIFISEFTDYQIGWALEREIKVIYNSKSIVSLEFYEYSFMGGAHPNTVRTFQSFDVKSGSKIVIEDNNVLAQLTAIAEKEFRRMRDIPDNQPLSGAGYWFENDEFYLNDNFAIINNGLVFYFNPYEIGPYALGPAKIVLKQDLLGELLEKIVKN